MARPRVWLSRPQEQHAGVHCVASLSECIEQRVNKVVLHLCSPTVAIWYYTESDLYLQAA